MIRIKSKKAGFRRCGIAHPAIWAEYPEGRFTAEELAELKAEPMLSVEIVVSEQSVPAGSGLQPEPDASVVIPAAAGIQEVEEAEKSGKEPAKAGKKGNK